MSVHPLCVAPHPVLRASAKPVGAFTDELRRLVRDMIETMYANDGIGLAAPQIGQDLQIVVANASQERGQETILINPVLEGSEGRFAVVEGCLSVPSVWEPVKRAARVRVRGLDPRGRPVTVETSGLPAIVLQHELDHLQGRLFIDRISWLRKRRLAWRTWVAGGPRIAWAALGPTDG